MFEVAYWWRLDPAVVLAMPISRALLYEQQAVRLARQMNTEDR